MRTTCQVILPLPPDPSTAQIEYCVHWQRELRSNWQTLWVLLTGKDLNGDPVAGLQPTTWWKQIIKLTTSDKTPNGVKGTPQMLSKHACKCLAHACISQCSCPHCTTFLENLDHRHLALRSGWREVEVGEECTVCGGDCCDPDGAWRNMSGGVLAFIKYMLCPAIEVPGVFINAIDPLTGLEIPDEVAPVKMIRKECWLGQCSKCGWENRFHKFPKLAVKIQEDSTTERQVYVRACPREARVDRTTTYHEFVSMERGLSQDGGVYTQPTWTPITVDRRTFYYRLHQFMENFLPHYYKVQWHETFDKVFIQRYRRLAFVDVPTQPQPHKSMFGTAILTKDFAAAIDHDKKFNKTCSHPERSHEWVAVYECSPYLHRYTDADNKLRHKKNRSVTSVVAQKVFGVCAFSKRRGDTVFDQTAQLDLVHIMKTGRVPHESRAEWFWQGKRLIGSCTSRPLPPNLQESVVPVPLHPSLLRIVDKRDRCAGQYQGQNAFYSNQEFESRAKITPTPPDEEKPTKVVDLSQTSCHGKGKADGFSNTPTSHLRQAAKDNQPVGEGTRGLVLFLADKMRRPSNVKNDSWGRFDEYLVAYYPEDGFKPNLFTAKSGYEGSNQDHFYTNSGLHRLATRHLRCMCSPCVDNIRLYSEACELVNWCGKIRHYNLEGGGTASSDHRVDVRPRRELQTLEEFAATLDTRGTPCERVIVCCVHEDDNNELDEPFYLARVVGKARTIDNDCLVSGNEYKKGELVVNIKWYLYISDSDSRGDRFYRLQPGNKNGVVYSVKSIVRNIDGIRFQSYENGKYVLGRETVKRLIRWLNE